LGRSLFAPYGGLDRLFSLLSLGIYHIIDIFHETQE